MDFLRSFLRHHFVEKAVVALQNVNCFFRLGFVCPSYTSMNLVSRSFSVSAKSIHTESHLVASFSCTKGCTSLKLDLKQLLPCCWIKIYPTLLSREDIIFFLIHWGNSIEFRHSDFTSRKDKRKHLFWGSFCWAVQFTKYAVIKNWAFWSCLWLSNL